MGGTNYQNETEQQAAVMEAEVASEGRAHTAPATKVPGKRGRPAGAKNKPKYDAQGNLIPLKKDLMAARPKGKRGRPKGSKNDTTKTESSVVDTFQDSTAEAVEAHQAEAFEFDMNSQDESFNDESLELPIGSIE